MMTKKTNIVPRANYSRRFSRANYSRRLDAPIIPADPLYARTGTAHTTHTTHSALFKGAIFQVLPVSPSTYAQFIGCHKGLRLRHLWTFILLAVY